MGRILSSFSNVYNRKKISKEELLDFESNLEDTLNTQNPTIEDFKDTGLTVFNSTRTVILNNNQYYNLIDHMSKNIFTKELREYDKKLLIPEFPETKNSNGIIQSDLSINYKIDEDCSTDLRIHKYSDKLEVYLNGKYPRGILAYSKEVSDAMTLKILKANANVSKALCGFIKNKELDFYFQSQIPLKQKS